MQNEGMKNSSIFQSHQSYYHLSSEGDFTTMIKTYESVIHKALSRYVPKDSADYEDLKQESLIKAWKDFSRFRKGIVSKSGTIVTPEQWLYINVRYVCCKFFANQNKKSSIKISYTYEIPDYSSVFTAPIDLKESSKEQEKTKLFYQAIYALPEVNQKYIKYIVTGHSSLDIKEKEQICSKKISKLKKQTITKLQSHLFGSDYVPINKGAEQLLTLGLHDALDKYYRLKSSGLQQKTKWRYASCKKDFQQAAFELQIDAKKVSELSDLDVQRLIDTTVRNVNSDNSKVVYKKYLTGFLIYTTLKESLAGKRPLKSALAATDTRLECSDQNQQYYTKEL